MYYEEVSTPDKFLEIFPDCRVLITIVQIIIYKYYEYMSVVQNTV